MPLLQGLFVWYFLVLTLGKLEDPHFNSDVELGQ